MLVHMYVYKTQSNMHIIHSLINEVLAELDFYYAYNKMMYIYFVV